MGFESDEFGFLNVLCVDRTFPIFTISIRSRSHAMELSEPDNTNFGAQ